MPITSKLNPVARCEAPLLPTIDGSRTKASMASERQGVEECQMNAKTIEVKNDAKRGFYLKFGSGFESAMPNENAARMLAQSPELLRALKEMYALFRGHASTSPDVTDALNDAYTAIKKAESAITTGGWVE